MRKQKRARPENRTCHCISNESRLTHTAYCIGLVVFLAMMRHELRDMLGSVCA